MRTRAALLLVTLASLGCGSTADPEAADDAGVDPDGAFVDDAPKPDTSVDAATDTATGAGDTGASEGGPSDTGAVDAGSTDAGSTDAGAKPPYRPFGSHGTTYAAGALVPSDKALEAKTAAFYDAWKKKYLVAGCGAGRWYLDVRGDAGGATTVSEAHGWAMLFVAHMAGHDPEAKTIFDGLYAYFRDHPAASSPDLMAWKQTGCTTPGDGKTTATDGDLDIAYALLVADAQWGSGGATAYRAEAKKVIAAAGALELSAKTKLTLLGDWAKPGDAKYYTGTRTSDFLLGHFRVFATVGDATLWNAAVDAHAKLIDTLQTKHAPATGLLPDFVVGTDTTPAPAPAGYLESANDGAYAWNASRDPFRLGADWVVSGDARTKTALGRLNAWIRGKTGGDATKVDDGYRLDGTSLTGGIANELAFLAPFGVAAMADPGGQAWLDAIVAQVIGRSIDAERYFGNTIKLGCLLVLSRNWIRP